MLPTLATEVLDSLGPWRGARVWHVAFSGGLDSSVLLHILARLSLVVSIPPLRAIHVHHGLQACADDWAAHCREVCAGLGIPLQVIRVTVEQRNSLERAAREARYAAFARQLGTDEVLLTAQHADDQAETLLFRLLRGSGVRGLAGMPVSRALGVGTLVRPLLGIRRETLERYAREQALTWVEDPSNRDSGLARNFLRQNLMPVLRQYAPAAVEHMVQSAHHLREADALLGELAEQDLDACRSATAWSWLGLPNLELPPLQVLSESRQRNALRHWLRPLTLMPSTVHWQHWSVLRDAAPSAEPVWSLDGGKLVRSRQRLWWLPDAWEVAEGTVVWKETDRPLFLPGNGCVELTGEVPSGDWHIGYRQGGERMQLPGRGHRDLKRLLNERAVPVFLRARIPLLFHNGDLVAVANIAGLDGRQAGTWQCRWSPPISMQSD